MNGRATATREGVVKRLNSFGKGSQIRSGYDVYANGDTMVAVPVIRIHDKKIPEIMADTFYVVKTDTWEFGEYYAYFDWNRTKSRKLCLLDKRNRFITVRMDL